ncbi:MAG: response regulator transcription factor [Acidobacteria bacterium]|nr:response regulator transcription factor [Acidobacteriota bacterium]
MKNAIRVAVADDNVIGCELLVRALSRRKEFAIQGYATSSSEFRRLLEPEAHVALVGSSLRDGQFSGLGLIKELRTSHPSVRSVALLDNRNPQLVVQAFRAGARGVFERSISKLSALVKCLRTVHHGQIWATSTDLEHVIEELFHAFPLRVTNAHGEELLSAREKQIVRLVADGLSNREIAAQLKLSEHTVKNHLFRMFDKLGVSSRVEVVRYAVGSSQAEEDDRLNGAVKFVS